MVDASDSRLEARADTVNGLLGELGFSDIPRIVLLNKVDRLDPAGRSALPDRLAGVETLRVSAATGEGLDEAVAAIAGLIPMPPPGLPTAFPAGAVPPVPGKDRPPPPRGG